MADPHPPLPPDDDADLDRWLDQLAGRRPADAHIQALRQAMVQQARAQQDQRLGPLASDEAEAHALQRLQFRLRRQGLLNPPRRAWAWRALPLAAAAALAIVVGTSFYRDAGLLPGLEPRLSEPPQYRGSVPDILLPGPQPLQRAQQAAVALRPVAQDPVLYLHDGRAVLDFELPADRLAEAQALLTDRSLATALRPGLNRWVFTTH
jgi:hypothetical protein